VIRAKSDHPENLGRELDRKKPRVFPLDDVERRIILFVEPHNVERATGDTSMRIRSLIGTAGLLAIAAFATVSSDARDARADGEFNVSVSGSSVTVSANSPWHINQEYTWKVKQNGKTVDSVHFTLTAGQASASGLPSGSLTLKGAVCNTDGDHKSCMPFSKDITVQ
jgi:hypothetical protein